MRVRLAEPELIDDLEEFLERLGCIVGRVDEATLLVSIPRSFAAEAAQMELDLYLRLWEAVNPNAPAQLVS